MKRYLLVVCCVFAILSPYANAAEWEGDVSDDWMDAGNWVGSVLPAGTTYIRNANPAVLSSGDSDSVGSMLVYGDAVGETATLSIQGVLNCTTLKNGNFEGGTGIITVDGGTVNMSSYANIGSLGTGTLVMNSGTINGCTKLSVPSPYYAGIGYGNVELNGGAIYTAELYMNDHGVFDVNGGTLYVDGDVVTTLNSYYSAGYILCAGGTRTGLVIGYDPGEDHTYMYTGLTKAFNPSPADRGHKRDPNSITLTWDSGDFAADGHDLYLGTDYNAVLNATTTSDPCNTYKGNLGVESYSPGNLDSTTTYYWRVDEVNDPKVYAGDVWVFTTGPGFPDDYLESIQAGFESRRNQMLDSQIESPATTTSTGKLVFALSALYRNTQTSTANTEIIAACDMYLNDPDFPRYLGEGDDFHWKGNILCRIYEFFSQDSSYWPGRLTSSAEDKILETLWTWADIYPLSHAELTESETWWIYGSENHDMMFDSTKWHAAKILKENSPYNTYQYDDGYTAEEHFEAWDAYFKEYLKERAKKGMFVEIACKYNPYTLQAVYNFYDFSDDITLRTRAGLFLDLYWAGWSQEQLNGVSGGGKTRSYPVNSQYGTTDGTYELCWFYIGVGKVASKSSYTLCPATSSYRMPNVVLDLALDTEGKGDFESYSRRQGINEDPRDPHAPPDITNGPTYVLDPDYGGLLRYTFCTPDFVIGSLMMESLPYTDWSSISSQNRWMGVIFSSGVDDRIYPYCTPPAAGSQYNSVWSAQSKGTLIVQKLPNGHSKGAGAFRVYVAPGLNKTEEDGYVFVETESAYAALRPAQDGYTWEGDNNEYMLFDTDLDPMILDVASKEDYQSYSDFKTDVKNNTLTINGEILTYEGIQGADTIEFHMEDSGKNANLPKIAGTTIDLAPSYTFNSPFLNEDWASGIVTISKDGRTLELDFNDMVNFEDLKLLAEQWLQTPGVPSADINGDGNVNLLDFALLAENWME